LEPLDLKALEGLDLKALEALKPLARLGFRPDLNIYLNMFFL
jgi:hypothetical protein